jgi:hypothetical protein
VPYEQSISWAMSQNIKENEFASDRGFDDITKSPLLLLTAAL